VHIRRLIPTSALNNVFGLCLIHDSQRQMTFVILLRDDYFNPCNIMEPISVAVRSKTWVCGLSLVGIVGSNPAGGIDVCLL
jgi:hypothetical protein